MKIKKGDNVIVIAGKDKGKTGKVLKSLPTLNKVITEGVNVAKKHSRNKFSSDKKGEIIDKLLPVNSSNVSLIDPKSKKATRISYKVVNNKKVGVAKKSGQEI